MVLFMGDCPMNRFAKPLHYFAKRCDGHSLRPAEERDRTTTGSTAMFAYACGKLALRACRATLAAMLVDLFPDLINSQLIIEGVHNG